MNPARLSHSKLLLQASFSPPAFACRTGLAFVGAWMLTQRERTSGAARYAYLPDDAQRSDSGTETGGVLMAAWVWVLIAVGIVAVLAVVAWQALARRRSGRLQERFGPEYDRAVDSAESKRQAEAELQAREERRE